MAVTDSNGYLVNQRDRAHSRAAWWYLAGGIGIGLVCLSLKIIYLDGGNLPWVIKLSFLLFAVVFLFLGKKSWLRGFQFHLGIAGENFIKRVLRQKLDDWLIVGENVSIRDRFDLDIVLRSPQGRYFVIDVKAIKGDKKLTPGGKLLVNGRAGRFRRRSFTSLMRRQAVEARQRYETDFVIPVLCFTRKNLVLPEETDTKFPVVDRVLVVHAGNLCEMLEEADSRPFF